MTTHKRRMEDMRRYGREATRLEWCMVAFLGMWVAFSVWLNVDAVLWYLGK